MDEAYLEEATKSVVELLQQITEKLDKLESIDKSIDFLAAAMTGMDPMDIEMGQTALGRLAIPIMRNAPQKQEKVDENIHISDRIVEEIMEEEINAMLEQERLGGSAPGEQTPRQQAAAAHTAAAEARLRRAAAEREKWSKTRDEPPTSSEDFKSKFPDAERETAQGELDYKAGFITHPKSDVAGIRPHTVDTDRAVHGLVTGDPVKILPGEKGFVPGEINYHDYSDDENLHDLPGVDMLQQHAADVLMPEFEGDELAIPPDTPPGHGELRARDPVTYLRQGGIGRVYPKQIRPGEKGHVPGKITYRDRLEEIIEEEIMTMLNQQEV
jgi:hypothetical protein